YYVRGRKASASEAGGGSATSRLGLYGTTPCASLQRCAMGGGRHLLQACVLGFHPAPCVPTSRDTSGFHRPTNDSTMCAWHCCGGPSPPGGARTSRPG